MKTFNTFKELYDYSVKTNPEIYHGRGGWIKGKCLDDGCDTTTYWNSKSTGVKCADGKCAKCGGAVKRTVSASTTNYIILERL